MRRTIGFIPGNDYGLAVGSAALRALEALGHDVDAAVHDLGPARYLATGEVLPGATFEALRAADAVLVGAPPVGGDGVPPGLLERGIVFGLRTGLDLYVNLRVFEGAGPFGPVDVAVVRENTEGAYLGEGGALRAGTPHEVATQGSVNTRRGVERCIRYAFELAARRRGHVTLVHKAAVLEHAGALWARAFDAVRAEHPGIGTAYCNADTACIHLVRDPGRFDVLVTDNLFGDLLSDLAGALAGTMHLSGSADLNPAGPGPSLFEAIHGVGTYDQPDPHHADPRAAMAAAAMLLDHLGDHGGAARLAGAVRAAEPGPGASRAAIEEAVIGAL